MPFALEIVTPERLAWKGEASALGDMLTEGAGTRDAFAFDDGPVPLPMMGARTSRGSPLSVSARDHTKRFSGCSMRW